MKSFIHVALARFRHVLRREYRLMLIVYIVVRNKYEDE